MENLFHVECNSVDDLMAVLEEGEVSHFCIPGIYVFLPQLPLSTLCIHVLA